MANGKKSFILYADILNTVKHLTNEQAGMLFKTILEYVNDQNPSVQDILTAVAFEPIKQQLKRDLKKWKGTKGDRSDSGKLGNIKRWHKDLYDKVKNNEMTLEESLIIANDRKAIKGIANVAVNDNVNVNDNVSVINKYIKPEENYKLDLPENKIDSAIQYLTLTNHIKADRSLVLSLWTVFKQKKFTGENSYKSEAKIFTHFFESLKFEKINGTHQQTISSSKPGTAIEQNEAADKW